MLSTLNILLFWLFGTNTIWIWTGNIVHGSGFVYGIKLPEMKTVSLPSCLYDWSHHISEDSLCITHWGRVTHICIGNLTIIVSDNGLSPGRRQAIIWTNTGILLIGPLGTNFNEILIEIQIFSFKKTHLKMSSGKRRPFCLSLNVITQQDPVSSLYCGYSLGLLRLVLAKLYSEVGGMSLTQFIRDAVHGLRQGSWGYLS